MADMGRAEVVEAVLAGRTCDACHWCWSASATRKRGWCSCPHTSYPQRNPIPDENTCERWRARNWPDPEAKP